MSKAKPNDTSVKPSAGESRQISEQEIAQRAYDLYLARGSQDGHDLEDWLEAERQLSRQSRPEGALATI